MASYYNIHMVFSILLFVVVVLISQAESSTLLQHRRGNIGTGAETCSIVSGCIDGSCCGINGVCGYGPTYCGNGNCTSNCDATSMCGINSAGGNISCGMKLCCSFHGWCGTDEAHCGISDSNGQEPCQTGFGACAITSPPSCSATGGSSNGRTIAYYQSSNVRNRLCNRIFPSHINTTGLTHLYFAFASIDKDSFAVVPSDTADVAMYTDFTALKRAGELETWIAIGGFDFSDEDAPTHKTWSTMVSTQSNRAAFITSLLAFMQKFEFQGVDLDWEYPAIPSRGGVPSDTKNFVSLVAEMRARFGSTYGISLTVAPDIEYIIGFDAISMQPYVDWFGFMAYDLHGYWDAENPNVGPIVRGQTDIREILNDTLPMWFDGLNPSKVNLGLAYYGRGFTIDNQSCNTLGCIFTSGSKPGACTGSEGVMSLVEIETLIQMRDLTPKLLPDIGMKQLTWDDQWMGYDDSETIGLKKKLANQLCIGGTMIWSIDFYSGNGDSTIPSNTTNVSYTNNATCGNANNGLLCALDNPNGACCSSSGYCGNSDAHCGAGCQSGPCTTDVNAGSSNLCGVQHAGAYCGTGSAGPCCSGNGFCGSGSSFCDLGCQSGACSTGFNTTDGTCGVGNKNSICGNWPNGGCCSESGFCGSTEAYCGAGCQSGPCCQFNPCPSKITTSLHVLNCSTGQTTSRVKLIDSINNFCTTNIDAFDGTTPLNLVTKASETLNYTWDDADGAAVNVQMELSLTHPGCLKTPLSQADCVSNFTSIIDNCNTDTVTKKQGGSLTTDCLTFNVDPILNPYIVKCTPPPSPQDLIAGRQIALPILIIEVGEGLYLEIAGNMGRAIKDIVKSLQSQWDPDKGSRIPPENDNNCRLSFTTQGGGDCYAQTFPAQSSGNDSSSANLHTEGWDACSWPNPNSTAPPIQYFNDPGIGNYSIQFTATDKVAWSGANGTETCVAEGLCNPILTFYRPCWNMKIYTWLASNQWSVDSYTGSWYGLCTGGDNEVLDQFSKGGDVLGDTCAIPCWNDVGLPSPYDS